MKRRKILIALCSAFALVVVGGFFFYWQLSRMKFSLSNDQIELGKTLTLGAMSNVALDRSVLGDSSSPKEAGKPLLAQYKDNPELFRMRETFTMTWLIAGRLAQDLTQSNTFPTVITSSSDLTQVAPNNRIDAWKNPYCVLVDNGAIVVMSSGDKGPLPCKPLQAIAEELSISTSSAQLKRLSNDVLVTVLHVASLRDQQPRQ